MPLVQPESLLTQLTPKGLVVISLEDAMQGIQPVISSQQVNHLSAVA